MAGQENIVCNSIKRVLFSSYILLLLLFIVSCEQEIEWDLQPGPENTIVVNARITNEFKVQRIQLSYPVKLMNDLPEPFTGALVKVFWGEDSVSFSESDSIPGIYYSDQAFAAAVNKEYFLTIEKGDISFQAKTYMVPVLPFNLPFFSYHQNRGLFSLNWNNSQYSPFEQAVYEADITWSHLFTQAPQDSLTKAKLRFYTLNSIDVNYVVFPQNKEEVLMPAGSIAIISKYSLNQEYGAYIRALLSESQWQGSLFETARGNLPGNISNGGFGYFSACAVLTDTLLIN